MNEFIQLADRLADASADVIMGHFRTDFGIENKSDASPVTIADRDAERAMRTIIAETFPDHGIIGEEFDNLSPDAEYVWALDPIDGTRSFVTGKPLFGTLIALVKNRRPILGMINMPALGERFVGGDGVATTMNGKPLKVRDCGDIADAWLYTTSPHYFEGADMAAFERLRERTHHTVYGGDCYAYGLVAMGTVDLVCEAGLDDHDFCALVPVIEGAGGIMTDWQGKPMDLGSDGRVLAAGSKAVHAAAVATLRA